MNENLDILVVDLNQVDPEIRRDLETLDAYRGVLSATDLYHLAHIAREREARDADRLSRVLYG